jgi:hypothetical protein
MPRPETPIADAGPIGAFAAQLREFRASAPGKPTYRQMSTRAHLSHSVLAEAAAGKTLPSWETTEAYVRACGATDEDVRDWRTFWLGTTETILTARRRAGQADLVVSTRDGAPGTPRRGRLRPVEVDHAGPDQCRPQPDDVRTFDDLRYQLTVLRINAGNPSLRDLNKLMKATDGVYAAGPSTLSEVFTGQRHPAMELFMAIVTTLLGQLGAAGNDNPFVDPPAWRTPPPWREAWARAQFNHQRPDLQRTRRVGNILLLSDHNEAPVAAVVAAMNVKAAAATLAAMPPDVAGRIIEDLPTKKAQQVLDAMYRLHDTTTAAAPNTTSGHPGTQAGDPEHGSGISIGQ